MRSDRRIARAFCVTVRTIAKTSRAKGDALRFGRQGGSAVMASPLRHGGRSTDIAGVLTSRTHSRASAPVEACNRVDTSSTNRREASWAQVAPSGPPTSPRASPPCRQRRPTSWSTRSSRSFPWGDLYQARRAALPLGGRGLEDWIRGRVLARALRVPPNPGDGEPSPVLARSAVLARRSGLKNDILRVSERSVELPISQNTWSEA